MGCLSSQVSDKTDIYERRYLKSYIRPTLIPPLICAWYMLLYPAHGVCLMSPWNVSSLCASVRLDPPKKAVIGSCGEVKKKRRYISCLVRNEKPEQMCLGECLFSMEK